MHQRIRGVVEPLELRRLLAATVSGAVWRDADGDGIRDAGESGARDVVVELFSPGADLKVGGNDDVSFGTRVTNASGQYSFGNLAAGSYYLDFRTPAGYAFSPTDQGGDDTKDSDAAASGFTPIFALAADQTDSTRSAALTGAAPSFGFATRVGSSSDYGRDVALDAQGNTYLLAKTYGGLDDYDPGPGTFNLPIFSGYTPVVVKYSPGGALIWVRAWDGSSGIKDVSRLAIDSASNVYVAGKFNSVFDADPGKGVHNIQAHSAVPGNAAIEDAFLVKLDSNGNFEWGDGFGGPDVDIANSVALDSSGANVFITGVNHGTGDFDPGAGVVNLVSGPGNSAFVAKLKTSDGSLVWARATTGDANVVGNAIAVDTSGNVVVGGQFAYSNFPYDSGTADFDPGPNASKLQCAGGLDGFVWKLNSAGSFVWAASLGTSSAETISAIGVDTSGNVYAGGLSQGKPDFDPGAGTFLLDGANRNSFLWKLSSAGQFAWADAFGGAGMRDLTVDANANVYATGSFGNVQDFDPGAAVHNLDANTNGSVYVLKLTSGGAYADAFAIGGSGTSSGEGIAANSSGDVLTTGYFTSFAPTDFDPGAGKYALTIHGTQNAFIALTHRAPPVNHPPTITSLSLTPAGVTRGTLLTMTAGGVGDPDGNNTLAAVAFYRDSNGNGAFDANTDTLLAQDTNSANGWSATTSTLSLPLGVNRFFTRAKDSAGAWSAAVTKTVSVNNAAPKVDSLAASPSPILRGATLALTATASDVDGTVAKVQFFRDGNGDGEFQSASDILLGEDTTPGDGWKWSGSTGSFPLGSVSFFARAIDNNGGIGGARKTSAVINTPPTIGSLVASPNPVTKGSTLTLTAQNVADNSAVKNVLFYRDSNSNGVLDGADILLGTDTTIGDGWFWKFSTSSFSTGATRFFSKAIDNNNAAGNVVTTVAQIT